MTEFQLQCYNVDSCPMKSHCVDSCPVKRGYCPSTSSQVIWPLTSADTRPASLSTCREWGRGLHGTGRYVWGEDCMGQGSTYEERIAWDREVRMGRGLHGTGR